MLRYLVQSPPDPRFPDEKNHEVDLAFGLGLSSSVWQGVRDRFGIPWIVEYYSASEATMSLVNSNKGARGVGKIAHWGPLMRSSWFGQSTFYILRTDLETGDILRDPKTGFCMTTAPGEVGESISRIVAPVQRRHDYVGEGGAAATEKKMLRDVFETGDQFYRLGDALAMVSGTPTLAFPLLSRFQARIIDSILSKVILAIIPTHSIKKLTRPLRYRTQKAIYPSTTDSATPTAPKATTSRRPKSRPASVDIPTSPP